MSKPEAEPRRVTKPESEPRRVTKPEAEPRRVTARSTGGGGGRGLPLAALVDAVVQLGGVHEVLQMLRKHLTAQVSP